MKKRIEKVVEWIDSSNGLMTKGKRYKVFAETKLRYSVMDNDGDIITRHKENFKVVSEREVLEFEGRNLNVFGKNHYSMEVISKVDLWNYDIKVIATPKDNPLESKSKEELIEIIKELKSKE
tara:strand:+ start:524 stop:889 length:366 start_codon:yes stop_codon:yes gene_type:complete